VTGALLALAVLVGSPVPPPLPLDKVGIATWYGDTTKNGPKFCHGGYKNTCSPYVPKSKGGRGGELFMYAATAEFYRYPKGATPRVKVCRRGTDKCVHVIVRDACYGCRADGKGGRVIDLSPAAFLQLAPLSRGVIYVTVQFWNEGRR